MNLDLREKTIFVTGGTSVLGERVVSLCVKNGATVLFTYHKNSEKAQSLIDLGASGMQLDLSDRGACREIKKRIKEKTATLDLFIHAAAVICDKTVAKLQEDEWDYVVAVDLAHVATLTKSVLPLLYKARQGKILFITSQVGLHGAVGQANYAAAKGGLIAMTKSLAKELGRKKLLVNALNPGFMDSPMTRAVPDAVRQENVQRSCLSSMCDPEEVARFIVYYASDYIATVSGQVFSFDSRIY